MTSASTGETQKNPTVENLQEVLNRRIPGDINILCGGVSNNNMKYN
jgi:hypothetical protein